MIKSLRTTPARPWLLVMTAALTLSLYFAWRYYELGRTVDANKAQLAANLRASPESSEDASTRVARAVAADEQLFDDTLLAASARRTAAIISIAALGVAFLALAIALGGDRWLRTRLSGRPSSRSAAP